MRVACSVAQGCGRARLGWAAALPQRRRLFAAASPSSADAALQQEPPLQAQQQQTATQTQSDSPVQEDSFSPFEKMMHHTRLTDIAQALWTQVLRPGDTAVDATCGNGHDTTFLAQAVGREGTVHAIDVQPAAIEATRRAVGASVAAEVSPEVHFHLASHADMLQLVGSADCARLICFNLGYLPGSDKGTTTEEGSTLAAVQAACQVLQPDGLCSILCYTGHPGGMREYEALLGLLEQLPKEGWVTSEMRLVNRPSAPVLLLLWKRRPRVPKPAASVT